MSMNYEEFKHDIQNAPAGGMTPFEKRSNVDQDESLFNKLNEKDATGAVPSFSGGSKQVRKTSIRRKRNQRGSRIFNKDLDIN